MKVSQVQGPKTAAKDSDRTGKMPESKISRYAMQVVSRFRTSHRPQAPEGPTSNKSSHGRLEVIMNGKM